MSTGTIIPQLLPPIFAMLLALPLSAGITSAIRPLLSRYSLAAPNARSSHRIPTPQGAGIAVIASTLVAAGAVIACNAAWDLTIPVVLFGATVFMGLVGIADDVKPIPVIPRLLLQALAVGAVLFASADLRIVPALPVWAERGLLLLAGVWFVNLVNFMDGLDLMTVVEVIPITGALVVLGVFGEVSPSVTIVAAAMAGAMIGFAPFNRPVAKVFLGDVGSLPIGLLLGWCLLELLQRQHFVAACLLPLYYLSDTAVTLLRRLANREPFWTAHRKHFYQRATDNGFTVNRVVSDVFVLNVGLAILAIASIMSQSNPVRIFLLLIGCFAVALTLYRFSRRR